MMINFKGLNVKTLKGLNVTCTRGIVDGKAICYVWTMLY